MKTHAYICAMIALVCMGCEKPAPEIVLVTPEPTQLALPFECTSLDPDWIVLPDTAIKKADLPRNARSNESQYIELLGKRKVCRDAIKAQSRKG